ncbi:hypothetical protein HOLleu_28441 [Holothuria leucospilota]|uniref:Uncharacterized protein n=1 Tax=Holothuria leucospilota TaxID=206669 RepID=A0A9Q1BLY9_HOLLE|nr:hypothetical protein HOLleu_28441 [Holothuria leucospilota]
MKTSPLWLVLSILSTSLLKGTLVLGDICGFTSAVTDHDHHFIVLEDQEGQWSLQVNFSWTRPSGDFDAYYIKLVDKNTRADYGCNAKEGYMLTIQTWHLFGDLDFGFSYEVHIRLYNNETSKTSFLPVKIDIKAPDCYEKTESIEFCMQQPIPTTTKAREPRVESIGLNDFGNGTNVVISWLPPVQINGAMDYISVSYRKEFALANDDVIQFRPADVNWNGNRQERFNTTLFSLLNDTIYIVTIKPIVIQNEGRLLGETLEFRVNTSLLTDSDSQGHDGSSRTPHSSTPDYATNPTSPAPTGPKDSFLSRLSAKWQLSILFIIPVIVLCGVIFVLLFVYVKRKTQQMTVVSS